MQRNTTANPPFSPNPFTHGSFVSRENFATMSREAPAIGIDLGEHTSWCAVVCERRRRRANRRRRRCRRRRRATALRPPACATHLLAMIIRLSPIVAIMQISRGRGGQQTQAKEAAARAQRVNPRSQNQRAAAATAAQRLLIHAQQACLHATHQARPPAAAWIELDSLCCAHTHTRRCFCWLRARELVFSTSKRPQPVRPTPLIEARLL